MTVADGAFGNRDAEIIELVWPVVLQGDAVASYNWVAGVMSLDVDLDVWQAKDETTTDYEAALRGYHHEMWHAIQFSTMSFPYIWATELYNMIQPVLARHASSEEDDFSGIRTLVNRGSACLTDEERHAISEHYRLWTKAGPGGITAKSVLESHAYFVERTALYGISEPHIWFRHIQDAPDLSYRSAYDYLLYSVGPETAFDWFSLVASLALSTMDPGVAFERYAMALRTLPSSLISSDTAEGARDMMAFCGQISIDLGLNGALEAWTALGRGHPVLHETAERLHGTGLWELVDLWAFPRTHIADAMARVEAPIVFRPYSGGRLATQSPLGMDRNATIARMCVGAIGSQLCRPAAISAADDQERTVDKLRWLSLQALPRFVTLSDEELAQGTAKHLIATMAEMTAEQKMSIWGCLAFRIARDPELDGLSAIPEFRGVLQDLAERDSTFAIYQHPDLSHADWFSAVAPVPSDASSDDILDTFLKAARDAALAIKAVGFEMDQNTTLIAEKLTSRLIASVRDALKSK